MLTDTIKVLIVLPFLAFVSYTDLKERKAYNICFYIVGLAGIIFMLLDFKALMLLTVALFIVIAVLWQRLTRCGIADRNCMIAMSFMYPLLPEYLFLLFIMAFVIGSIVSLFITNWKKSMPYLFPVALSYTLMLPVWL